MSVAFNQKYTSVSDLTVAFTLGDKLAAVSRSEGVEPQHAPARSQQARRRKDPLAPAEKPKAGTDSGAKLRNTIAAHFRNRASTQGELALTLASLMLGVHIEVYSCPRPPQCTPTIRRAILPSLPLPSVGPRRD